MKLIALILLLFQSLVLFSQTYSGTIFTKDDKEPALFTTLHIPQTGIGTVSDLDGKFNFTIPKNYHHLNLQISFVGYKTKLIPISKLKEGGENIIWLEIDQNNLQEIVLSSKRRPLKPLQVLKKALKNIEENYPIDTTEYEGYYREKVSENGQCVKYADAVIEMNYGPYSEKKWKWKDYYRPSYQNVVLSDISLVWGERFHRGHYPINTLMSDELKIIESRASDNLSPSKLRANIEGGPLGLFGKDRVKFRKLFMKKSQFSKYEYTIQEEEDSLSKMVNYVVYFKPKYKPKKQRFKLIQIIKNESEDLMAGSITIDRNTFAIKRISYSVPKHLKNEICDYKSMNLKHFDYQISVNYKEIDGKYYVSDIKQKDEFVYTDTVLNTRTAYNSTQEIFLYKTIPNSYKPIESQEMFANVDANQVFEHPLEYDTLFWENYMKNYPEYKIPQDLKSSLEKNRPLLDQFASKSFRDENFEIPIAPKKEMYWKNHGKQYLDEYAWLKDTKAPKYNTDVMDYIHAENDYYQNYIKPLKKGQRLLFKELKQYSKLNTSSLPVKYKNYKYYTKYKEEQNYPVYYRKRIVLGEEIELFDVNKMAQGHIYYNLSVGDISPNEELIGFYENTTGSDLSVFKIKDTRSNTILKDSLINPGSVVWISDTSLYYSLLEPKTNRSYQIKEHILGQPSSKDKIIFTEQNPLYSVSVGVSEHNDFAYLYTGSTDATEIHVKSLKKQGDNFKVIYPRSMNMKYDVEYRNGYFYILTNHKAIDRQLVRVDTADGFNIKKWEEIIPYQEGVALTSYQLFKNHLVYKLKEKGQGKLYVKNLTTQKVKTIKINQELYSIGIGSNPDFDTDTLQYSYASFKTPTRVMNYNMNTEEETMIKYDTLAYPYYSRSIKTKRIWATAKDGVEIPITLVYNKYRAWRNSTSKTWLTSYGSYGSGMEVGFMRSILPLLDRGFVYAIAHVRGGNDLGENWHKDGKMMNKKNTFTDFIACSEKIIEEGYSQKGNITIQGGSAGGLLMGAVANMRPDLYKAVILDVPFVDVMNTMMDDKLPLTTGEYLEWGNPQNKKAFDYMMSYSPYDNVKAQEYPTMLFYTGLYDTRVGYWEPAKMVAKLRSLKTDNRPLLLHTNLDAGHGGGSGRFTYYRELAMKYAIVFELYRSK